jgi:hypothetical protein
MLHIDSPYYKSPNAVLSDTITLIFDMHAVERLWNDLVNPSGANLSISYCLLPWPPYLPLVPLRNLEPVSPIPVIRVF